MTQKYFYDSPRLEETGGIFAIILPRKNLKTREPPKSRKKNVEICYNSLLQQVKAKIGTRKQIIKHQRICTIAEPYDIHWFLDFSFHNALQRGSQSCFKMKPISKNRMDRSYQSRLWKSYTHFEIEITDRFFGWLNASLLTGLCWL